VDIANAERLGVPSAIIFGKEPVMRVFTPGVTKSARELSGYLESEGDPFEFTPPVVEQAPPVAPPATSEPANSSGLIQVPEEAELRATYRRMRNGQ
jgi:hypothetical protein